MFTLMLALSMAAQDTTHVQVRVPPPNVTVQAPSVTVQPPNVYVQLAVDMDSLAAVLQARLGAAIQRENSSSGDGVVSLAAWKWGSMILFAGALGWWLRGRTDKGSPDPFHDHDHDDDHDHDIVIEEHYHGWVPPGQRKKKGG